MKVRKNYSSDAKIEMQMTPMIDVVFQLLTFFIMSFKVVSLEGNFNIRMPLGVAAGPSSPTVPPLKLRMRCASDGTLASMRLNDQEMGVDDEAFKRLQNRILGLVGNPRGPTEEPSDLEVEIDTDYKLRYEYVIMAMTAVSGLPDGQGGTMKLIEKVRFASPRAQEG